MCQSDWSAKMQGGYSKRYGAGGQVITYVVPRFAGDHPRTADIYTNDFRHDADGTGGKQHATVFHQWRPLTFVLKITGLLPLYDQVSSYEVTAPAQGSAYYTLFVRLAMHAFTIFYLYNLFSPGANRIFYSYSGDTVNVNQYIEILLCVLTYSATLLISTKNAAQLLAILNEILRVNEDVYQKFAVTLPDSCSFVWKFMVGIVCTQCYLLGLNVWQLDIPFDWRCAVLLGFYAVQNCLSGFFIVYTSALLRFITQRFLYVNALLTGYTYGRQRKAEQPRRFVVRRVRETVVAPPAAMDTFPDESLFAYRMHNKLLRIYKSINDSCSLILVAYMGYAFYSITTNTYNLFVLITTGGWSVSVLQWGLVWLVLHISLLALLSRNCGEATREANVTSQILARVYGKNKEYQNIIDKFLTKSIKQEVEFTAYGFFVIDNSTLFKIFSAVTTYLVILIQFRQLEDSKMEDQTPTTT